MVNIEGKVVVEVFDQRVVCSYVRNERQKGRAIVENLVPAKIRLL